MTFANLSIQLMDGDSMKFTFMLFGLLYLCSCSTISKSPYACSAAADSQILANGKIGTYFLGNIFQYGDCAISENLRIENGNFLKYKAVAIRKQIIDSNVDSRKDLMAIYELFSCNIEDETPLIKFSKKNYSELFENTNEISGRENMLLIRKKIKEDESIKNLCFR